MTTKAIEFDSGLSRKGPTPGPWSLANSNTVVARGQGWGGVLIAEVLAKDLKHKTHHNLEAEANARLIAAAPSLLEALSNLLASFDDERSTVSRHWAERARTALALAEGGE